MTAFLPVGSQIFEADFNGVARVLQTIKCKVSAECTQISSSYKANPFDDVNLTALNCPLALTNAIQRNGTGPSETMVSPSVPGGGNAIQGLHGM